MARRSSKKSQEIIIKMKNKTLEFVKNMGVSAIPFVLGGIAGAELSDLVTDNEKIISSVSTAAQYLTAYPVFIAMHARDNRDLYQTEGKWDKKRLAVDTLKILFSLGVAEAAYIVGRTGLVDYLLHKDFSSASASVTADLIATPFYAIVAIPLAKKTSIIRSDKK